MARVPRRFGVGSLRDLERATPFFHTGVCTMHRLPHFGSAVALIVTLDGARARADPVFSGQWYTFSFSGPGSFGSACGSQLCRPGIPSVFAPVSPWTFVSATPFTFSIQDLYATGDRFSLLVGGTLVGTTSPTATGADCTRGIAEAAMSYIADCQAQPLSSRGTFAFAAGSYLFEIHADESPYRSGAAAFGVNVAPSVVPEPATLVMVGSGLLLLVSPTMRRRRRPAA
ncbi:MAG: hypothetical protein ACR2M1_02760 [Gemmatimonadaceae bacterium]